MLLRDIIERVENKKSDYQRYNFTQIENNALMTFFDLAQEFETIEDFYNLCVAIPKVFFNLDARLYLIDPEFNAMLLTAKTENIGDALEVTLTRASLRFVSKRAT